MRKLIIAVISLIASVFLFYFFFLDLSDEFFLWNLKNISLFIFSLSTLITSIVFFVLFLFRNHSKKVKWLENRLERWNNISYHVNQAGDEVFNKLPVGILIYDDLEIKWANDYAKSLFQNKLIDNNLEVINKNLLEMAEDKILNMVININDKSYDVIHNVNNKLMYFFDQTDRENIKKKYKERTTAIGIIVIDNLDESLKKFDMQEKTTIRGQFLGEISDWVSDHEAYLQSISDDRLVMILDRHSLDKMIDSKFDILNKVRDISNRNHLRTSISIGIACYDTKEEELGSLAQNAIELAEKRGGDQVVVNVEKEKIQYFGGKTNALEKNSLVNARMQTLALKDAIESSNNIIIMTHFLADCDALGSMIGVLKLAKSSNKDAYIVFDPTKADTTVQKLYNKLQIEEPDLYSDFIDYDEAISLIKPNTLLVITDTQSPRIAMFPDLLKRITRFAVIDHHRGGENGFKDPIMSYVETYVSSTVELVSEMFMFYNQNITLTSLEASIMLAGIIVDTNNFTFRCGSRTFEAASTLKTFDADMIMVRTLLRESVTIEQELASALLNVDIVLDRFAIVMIPSDKEVKDRTMLAKISDRLLGIEGVDASFTIGAIENEKAIGISARSYEGVNVQLIMEEMGGGGHLNSAAAQLFNISTIEVKDMLLEILKREYYEDGEEKMKVILLADVKGKGTKNSIIDVPNGYGNYLLTNKLAIVASDENINTLKEKEVQEKQDLEQRRKLLEKLKTEIETKSINLYIKIGADGKLYGSITTKQICEEFEAQTGIHLDKRKIELATDINSVGIYSATVALDKDIIASIEINVLEK